MSFDLVQAWQSLNEKTVYQMHLGYPGSFHSDKQRGMSLAHFYESEWLRIQQWALDHPSVIYPQYKLVFVSAHQDDNSIIITHPRTQQLIRWNFPRQMKAPFYCLADFVTDTLGLLIVTVGHQAFDVAAQWQQERRFSDALLLQTLAVQTVDAVADQLVAHKRFSFGFSACPDLSMQHDLFDILDPADIGVSLSSLSIMSPQATISAMLFDHPSLDYFFV